MMEKQKTRYMRNYFAKLKKFQLFGLLIILLINGASASAIDVEDPQLDDQELYGQGLKKISDINILLPIQNCPDCRKVQKIVTAFNGCYSWKISHPNLINMDSVLSESNPECINRVEISNVQQRETKSLVWLTAKDQRSGSILKSQVKVAKISRIEIFSRFRQIAKGDRQHLEVRAYDDENNVFSTLEGFKFDWSILSGHKNIMRISLNESEFKKQLGHTRLDGGINDDDYFLKSLENGMTTIKVEILEKGYENVKPATITLTIIDPFMILPAEPEENQLLEDETQFATPYILPTTQFDYKLALIKNLNNQGVTLQNIPIPSNLYKWELEKAFTQLGNINKNGYFQSFNKPGQVSIQVIENEFKNNTAETDIFIVEPFAIHLSLADVNEAYLKQGVTNSKSKVSSFQKQLAVTNWAKEWIVVEEKYYLVKIELFDKDNNRIYQSKQIQYESVINTKYFEVIQKNLIGSELILKVIGHGDETIRTHAHKSILKSGLVEIKTQQALKYIFDKNKLKEEKEITITAPVKIDHPTDLILLPYSRKGTQTQQKWTLQGLGGSGSYTWSSENPNIASIGQTSKVKAENIGKTIVKLSDLHNPDNFAVIDVEVKNVHHLKWWDPRVEVPASEGQSALLHSIAVDDLGRKFTNCSSLDLSFVIQGEGIIQEENKVNNWKTLQKYVNQKENLRMMKLRHLFDQQPNNNFESDLINENMISDQDLRMMRHNNFGVCNQIQIFSQGVGLSRIKAVYEGYDLRIESVEAEVASYQVLHTQKPDYQVFLADLYSRTQSGQEFQTFEGFYPQKSIGQTKKHFVLSFGSSLTWELGGGGNFWKELINEYQTNWSVNKVEGTSENILQIKSLTSSAAESTVQIKCGASSNIENMKQAFEYKVVIKQSNRVSSQLLNPKSHEDQIEISCVPPSSQRLLWCQESYEVARNAPAILPRSKLLDNSRTHYVLVNTQHNIRLLMLDKQSRATLSHESIVSSMNSNNENLAYLVSNDKAYDRQTVVFKNQTGSVVINSVSTHYQLKMMTSESDSGQATYFSGSKSVNQKLGQSLIVEHPVKDQLKIEIVENVDIWPRQKTIYFQGNKNTYKFELLNGSGHFAVSLNDTDLASLKAVGRQVTIIPKKEGSLTITVKDIEIPESEQVHAELHISDIEKLELDTQGYLIEQGSARNMSATAFDFYGYEFDKDQYELMSFELEIETTGGGLDNLTRGLRAEHVIGNQGLFQVTGVEPGHYIVSAYIEKYFSEKRFNSNRVTSADANKIEVFPILQLYPETLLLTPNMRYTLKVIGGPSRGSYGTNVGGSHVEIKFDIEDRNIAEIDHFREISGLEIGDTSLFYNIIQTKSQKDGKEFKNILSQRRIPIKVRLVSSVGIPDNQQRIVYTGSLLKQIAVLKYKDPESGIESTFSNGIAPISFSWNSSHLDILRPYIPSSNNKDGYQNIHTKMIRDNKANNDKVAFTTSFNSSGIHANAMKAGEVMIRCKMAIEYPYQYRKQQNWFETSALLKVQDKLTISIPEFNLDSEKQTHLYLLPLRAKTKISTNKRTSLKLGYSMQSIYDYSTQRFEYKQTNSPIIELENNEYIQTLDKYGKVTIHISEDQAYGDQVVMLNVLITDIYSLSAQNFYEALSLPLGSSLDIPIKFQNEKAHLFANDIQGIHVGIELSHPRVVTAELGNFNSSLILQSQGTGECIVMIYLIKSPHIFDIFKVRVATLVQPSSPVHLHVGSDISFKIVNDQSNNFPTDNVQWTSGNSRVLTINDLDGKAKAVGEGKADIMISGSSNAVSIAHVSQVNFVEIDPNDKGEMILNVDDKNDLLRIRLKLFLKDQIAELMPITQYDGQTLIRQNVYLECITDQPDFILSHGEVNDLEGYFCNVRFKGKNSNQQIPNSVNIKVKIGSSKLTAKKLANLEIKLVGALSVQADVRSGISFGMYERQKSFNIYSLQGFQIDKQVDDSILKVHNSRESGSNQHTISLSVPKNIKNAFNTKLSLINQVTGDRKEIAISFDPQNKHGKGVQNKPPPPKQVVYEPTNGADELSISSTTYLIFIFLICIIYMNITPSNNGGLPSHPNIPYYFNWIWSKITGQHPGSHYRGGINRDSADQSRSFYSAQGSNNASANAGVYQQVRERMFSSPDLKGQNKEVPYNRFQQSRGSVISPQSMYKPVGNDSMYRDGGF